MTLILAYAIASIAQLAEQLICNQQVGGSSPLTSYKDLAVISILLLGLLFKLMEQF